MPVCRYSPAQIRATLPSVRRTAFEVEFLAALVNAGYTYDLGELRAVIERWEQEANGAGGGTDGAADAG